MNAAFCFIGKHVVTCRRLCAEVFAVLCSASITQTDSMHNVHCKSLDFCGTPSCHETDRQAIEQLINEAVVYQGVFSTKICQTCFRAALKSGRGWFHISVS